MAPNILLLYWRLMYTQLQKGFFGEVIPFCILKYFNQFLKRQDLPLESVT